MTATQPDVEAGVAYPDSGPLSLFTHLARTSLFLDALQQESLAPFGLSFGDYMVLRVLRYAGPPYRLSPTRIGELVLRTSGGMTKIIDRLEKGGLVRRLPDPRDRRGVLVGLSRKGVRVSEAASNAYREGRERILSYLASDEIGVIDSGLRRLLDVFELDRKAAR